MKTFLLFSEDIQKVEELISDGWEFYLNYGDHTFECGFETINWEADFTRKLETGGYDNHESGYGDTAGLAINQAYQNIKQEKRLKIRND